MNFKEWSCQYLIQRGLWPDEAEAIVDGHYQEPWFGKDIAGYPTSMLAAVALTLNDEAIKWITAHKPMHFARGIFEMILPCGAEGKAAVGEKGTDG